MIDATPEWRVEPGLLDYPEAVAAMEARVAAIRTGTARELVWLVEHPPLYTAGTSAEAADLLAPDRFPVFATGRGGRYTYHGPGQRVVYVMLDLDRRGRDIRRFIAALEGWIIAALADHGATGRTIDGKVGVWVDTAAGAAKIAAIGVRVRRWVSYHGLAINVAPDLAHFNGIVPCGLAEPVISLTALGRSGNLATIDRALGAHLPSMLAALAPENRSISSS
ncbi:lipoyl(octanoyl) transferase LipB [Sandarakinorhabdus sp. DWP1-3-1]|uniref:lipoyl(octanoyl) transferase LipB n=1 Tax=Sandarakinorhabdus sp. DWP1-3-1 TaxID=2804627 RepID=UPI003CED8317